MLTLIKLAEEILANAKKVDAYLSDNKFPPASVTEYNLEGLPPDLIRARDSLINASAKVKALVESPEYSMWQLIGSVSAVLMMQR